MKITIYNTTTADVIITDYVDALDDIVMIFADFLADILGIGYRTALTLADNALASGRVDFRICTD